MNYVYGKDDYQRLGNILNSQKVLHSNWLFKESLGFHAISVTCILGLMGYYKKGISGFQSADSL